MTARMQRPGPGSAWVGGLAVTILAYLLVMRAPLIAFASAPRSLPQGVDGDQAFHLWLVARARDASGFESFVSNCDWSAMGCSDLRAVPYEWRFFYALGRLAKLTGADAVGTISVYYLATILLNAIAAFAFIGVVSRRWILAGALGPLVAFQQSLVWRMKGHLALAAVWPVFAAAAALWTALEDIVARRRRRLAISLAALFALLVAITLGSHYYTLFAAILLPATTLAFLALHRREVFVRDFARRVEAAWFAAMILGAMGASLLLQRAAQGTARHEGVYRRPVEDVMACSATWRDYVQPTGLSGAGRLFEKLGLALNPRAIGTRWPWELHAFLGGTVVAAVGVTTLALAAWSLRRRRDHGSPSPDAPSVAVFAALTLLAAFVGTRTGGRLVHAAVPAARCFNRMAPFTALFACALVAVAWRRRPRGALALAAAVLAAGVAEHANAPLVTSAELVVPISADVRFGEALRAACSERRVRVEPAVGDYMWGPYRVYYLAQLARCRIDGVRGPGFRPFVSGEEADAVAPDVAIRWGPQANGFEHVSLERRSADGTWRPEAIYDGR